MLDIKEMLKTNDFSDLLNSTQEQRDKSGGNYFLFNQLIDYLSIEYIKQIAKSTFEDDDNIVQQIKKHCENIEKETKKFSNRNSDLCRIIKLS